MELILMILIIFTFGVLMTLFMALFMTFMRGDDYAIKRTKTEIYKSDSIDFNKTVQLQEEVGSSIDNDSTGLL